MVSGMVVADLVQTFLALFMAAVTFYALRHEKLNKKAIIDYENEFLDLHYEIVNRQRENSQEIIPLTFERQDQEYVEYLCRVFRKKWLIAHYVDKYFCTPREPSVEEHYLSFKALRRAPARMKIRLVRCAENFAVVDGGDNRTGYILNADGFMSDQDHLVFNIAKKFRYNAQQPLQAARGIEPGIELSSNRRPVQ